MDLGGWMAVAGGIALAAACGLRAFLPLLLLGAAGRAGWIPLAPSVSWLSGDRALIALAVATVLELAGDKVPFLDHMLDFMGFVVRPAAAWLASFALLHEWPAPWGQLVALALAGTALGVQTAKAKLRWGSTAITLGHGNPVLSILEDGTSLLLCVAALLAPLVALVLAAIALVMLLRRRRPATA